jgi:Flp pilus assembly protein TadD
MTVSSGDARQQARHRFDAAEYAECLKVAKESLRDSPEDIEMLVLAGRAGMEIDAPDALEHLKRASELAPNEAYVWHHYGEALATEGRNEEAEAAFRRTVELNPSDQLALSNLGHTALAAGRQEEGVEYLSRASDLAHAFSTAAISLVDMYRSFGQYQDALVQARKLTDSMPEDAIAWLDVAELSLQVGELDESRSAFEHLRDVDDIPGHEAYPLYGMIQVEIRRSHWPQVQELASQVAAIEPQGLSTDVEAFARAQSGESAADDEAQEPPTRTEIEAAIAASLATYRLMLADNRLLGSGGTDD